MNYIEIIGPQGVGKTSLLERLVAARPRGSSWVTYHEALFEIARQISWGDVNTMYGKYLYLLNRINPTSFKRIGISIKLINEIKPGNKGSIEQFDYLIRSHITYMNSDDLDLSAVNKARLLNWHFNAVQRCLLLEAFGYSKTVIFDEGPYKNHYGLKVLAISSITPGTMPLAVINCYTSTMENFERIKKRAENTNRLSVIHKDMDDEALMAMVETIRNVNTSNAMFLRNAGVPVLDTDLSGDKKEHDIGRIITFLQEHSVNRIDPPASSHT